MSGSTVRLSDGMSMGDGEFAYPESGNTVEFVPLGGADQLFSYRVTVASTPGTYTFRGEARAAGALAHTVIGDTEVRVGPQQLALGPNHNPSPVRLRSLPPTPAGPCLRRRYREARR